MADYYIVKLRDNRFGNSALAFEWHEDEVAFVSSDSCNEELGGQPLSTDGLSVLTTFAGMSLAELSSRANGALINLSGTHLNNGQRDQEPFFSSRGADNGGFRLETGNLMGVLRFRAPNGKASVQVEVLSRFDKGKDNHFLNYLLSKVFNCALIAEEVAAHRSSLLEVLLDILFVRRLGEAARGGLLRHYREFRNNDWAFKGRLDLSRHIRENVPLQHGIAYVKREIDFDVPVNRMILLAALTVNHRHPTFFEDNPDAADALRQLRMDVTEEHDLRMLLSRRDCREPVRHPFFREIWEPLRQIARMILEDEHWTLFNEATDDEEVSGVVFDGSWLWEEYVATVLAKAGFRHGTSAEPVLRVFTNKPKRFIPDFYRLDGSGEQGCDTVLDAKYKRSNPRGQREDVHQVLCYLLLTGATHGGLVFPPIKNEEITKPSENGSSEDNIVEENDNGGWSVEQDIASPDEKRKWACFSWAPIKPDNCDSWNSFCGYMQKQEEALVEGPPTA